jgi:hypothetical protein
MVEVLAARVYVEERMRIEPRSLPDETFAKRERILGASEDRHPRRIFGPSLRLRGQPGYYTSGHWAWS